MLRTLSHRLNSRHTIVHRCRTFPHNLIKPRTGRSSPSPSPSPCPCSALAVPAAKILNPPSPPVAVVVISNALLLPPLQKPTLPLPRCPCRGGGVPLLPSAAAAAGSSLYNYYYITNFNFNTAVATARRQFSTSPASSTEPVPQGSTPPSFPVNVNQGGDAHAVVSSSSEDFWDFLIRALRALVFFYIFFCSVAAVDIYTSPLTNRKIIVSDKKMFGKGDLDKLFRERITGCETLPSTDHFSCKVRSMLEEILSNMDKVIKQRPPSLNGIKWEIVVSKVPGITASACRNGKIIINPNSLQWLDTDGKLAFTIGHEVAHVVAKHSNEVFGNFRVGAGLIVFMHALSVVYNYIPQPFTFLGISLFPLLALLCLFIRLLCLSQRHELEADYIGMMLSASAGYDPREAHKYFIDENWVSSSRIPSFLRVHPPREKRAEALLQNKTMEKALDIYKNS